MADEHYPLRHGEAMVSYAQHGEDAALRAAFGDQARGFYIDIGANDPVVDSVTLHFYLSGWSGISIEPIPVLHAKLVRARARDINLCAAVSSEPGEVELFVNRTAPGLSTLMSEISEAHRDAGHSIERVRVPSVTLKTIAEGHARGELVDFLKVDAEGHEASILASVDFRAFRPRILLVEAGYRPEAWEPALLASGYDLARDDGCNRFYTREEEPDLRERLRRPPTVREQYVTYSHHRWEVLGPAIQDVATRLNRVKDRSPTLKGYAKRLTRNLGRWTGRA
jgi:FkbM family methyltransferase